MPSNTDPLGAKTGEPSLLRGLLACVFLGLFGLAAYSNSFQCSFVLDDYPHIVNSQPIRKLWPLSNVIAHNPTRPFIGLTLALNYAWSGLEPWSYHLVNLLAHIAAGCALFGLVSRTLLLEPLRDRFSPRVWSVAFAVALLWLVHPLQTAAVTYVIQRAEVFMTLFFFLCMYAFVRGATGTRTKLWFVAAFIFALLSFASKQVAVVLPITLLLYDRAFLSPSFRTALRARWLLYAALCALWIALGAAIALEAQRSPRFEQALMGREAISPWAYLATQCSVIPHYLRLAFWPEPLCFDYGWPVAREVSEIIPGALFLTFLLGTAIWAWRQSPATGFLGFCFFLFLAPTSSLAPLADRAFEHRMYLPLAPLLALVVTGGAIALNATWAQNPLARTSLGGLVVIAAGLAVFLTNRRNADYATEIGLWEDAVRKRPDNPRAHYNLGTLYLHQNPPAVEKAEQSLADALDADPRYAEARVQLGILRHKQGRIPESEECFRAALGLDPDNAEAHSNLAQVLVERGELSGAEAHLKSALKANPRLAEAHCRLSWVRLQQGNPEEALAEAHAALHIQPDSADALNNLGMASAAVGKSGTAIEHFKKALEIEPHHYEAMHNLAAACARKEHWKEAEERYEAALVLRPENSSDHEGLARVLLERGKAGTAEPHARKALTAHPKDPELQRLLGRVLVGESKYFDAAEAFALVLEAKSDDPEAHLDLGNVFVCLGQPGEAQKQYREALRVKPDWPMAMQNLARSLLFSRDPKFFDPAQAVSLAESACRLSKDPDPIMLDTLAAAYASTKRFEQAVVASQQAGELARKKGNSKLAEQIEARAEQYKKGIAASPAEGP